MQAVRAGSISGLVLQDPFQMGYLSVRAVVEHIQGKTVATRTDTGAKLVHRENLDQPEIQRDHQAGPRSVARAELTRRTALPHSGTPGETRSGIDRRRPES